MGIAPNGGYLKPSGTTSEDRSLTFKLLESVYAVPDQDVCGVDM